MYPVFCAKFFCIAIKFMQKQPKYNESDTWDRSVKFWKIVR